MALNLKNLHVLVVEDIAPMRDLTISVLKAQGFKNVSYASNGKLGFDAFCRTHPDIVLTDWNMPESSGVELVQKIRTSPQSPDKMVPVIMMTGYSSLDKVSQARDIGINEILIKPFSAKDLSKRIMNVIKSPRDFIITENFQGPCRRRREDPTFSGKSLRGTSTAPKKIIKANHILQAKVGIGLVDEESLLRAQSILDNNKIDFVPIAETFLDQLNSAIKTAKKYEGHENHRHIEDLLDPVMQIKANARIFKYELLGDLATTMMAFLDNLKMLDSDALEIIEANQKTLTHIIHTELKGAGGPVGKAIQTEMDSVCKRYMNSRAEALKNRLRQVLEEKAHA